MNINLYAVSLAYYVEYRQQMPQMFFFLPTGHLNVPLALRTLSEGLFRREGGGILVATLLEPESACGFVNFCVIPVEEGKELPVSRLIK